MTSEKRYRTRRTLQPRNNRFTEGHLGRACMAMVMRLCLCIMVQVLGVVSHTPQSS